MTQQHGVCHYEPPPIEKQTLKQALEIMSQMLLYLEADSSPMTEKLECVLVKYSSYLGFSLMNTAKPSSITNLFEPRLSF